MIYTVHHLTRVDYASEVRLVRLNLRLKPAPWLGHVLHDYTLKITPTPWSIVDQTGPFVVNRSRLEIRDPIRRLSIISRFTIEVNDERSPLGEADDLALPGPPIADVRESAAFHRDLSPMGPAGYLYPSPMAHTSPAIAKWAQRFFAESAGVIAAGRALMAAIHDEFTYDGSATTTRTRAEEAFAARHGVCQDFAHVMIVAARAHGIPAAYVSGYLRTLPPPGKPKLRGADAMHAWAKLWCGDEIGWVGFDPTNNTFTGLDHIFVGMGRDYTDVAPIDGVVIGGSGQSMTVSVDVDPV